MRFSGRQQMPRTGEQNAIDLVTEALSLAHRTAAGKLAFPGPAPAAEVADQEQTRQDQETCFLLLSLRSSSMKQHLDPINSVTAVTMSPSTSGIGVSLGTEDFDVGVGGRHGPRDQRGAWLEAAVCCEGVGGEGRWAASRMTVRERGGDFDVNMVPNDSAKPKFFSQRDCQLTHGFHSEPVDAASTAGGGGAGMTGGGLAGECQGHAECRNGSADPQINISAAATQELPSSWHVKTLITQGLVAPSVASKDDPKPIVSRTEQDQRTRSTVAMSLTRLGLPEPPSAGRAKAQVCKTFSGNVAANPLLGIFGTTTPGCSPPPAGRLTSAAAAAARTPPRPWEVRVLLLALLLAASVNGRYDRGGLQHTITWGRGNSHSSAVFGNGPTNVTAVLGHRASLPCQVKNLGPKDVSWIRQRDLHILTVGIFTYTSDDRFKHFQQRGTREGVYKNLA
ncbi:hypothetical protein O3P69_009066 [Scylla paramamosain]|uniref:Ig-like domain-containing protein n=1 Tax=Scylla paramamosain TaxID=85552 RepID=A0AAW0TQM6_SCYPA